MSNPNYLEVDVSRDIESPAEYMDPVCEAVEYLQRHLGKITLGNVGRTYRFPKPIRDLRHERLRWKERTNDLHVISTDQLLSSNPKTTTHGLAIVRPLDGTIGERHALVSHSMYSVTKITTVHEIGHLLGGKKYGEHFDGKDHCSDTGCTMNSYLSQDIMANYAISKDPVCLCDECLQQWEENINGLIRLKNLATVPTVLDQPEIAASTN